MTADNNNNTAALQGWVKSTDPKTGRVFYANHVTRKTQWDPPDGWQEQQQPSAATIPSSPPTLVDNDNDNEPLPSNWEVMHDPTTGKPFYVDHERKITTWTRPTAQDNFNGNKKDRSVSFKPAVATPPTSGNAALARILAQQQMEYSAATERTYEQEAMYYNNSTSSSNINSHNHSGSSFSSHPASNIVDFSDALPTIDNFKVQVVPDSLRSHCAHCQTAFGSVSNRRHHCRLCGDVFCDSCSNHRVELPLEGAEYNKPVRVCDYCQADVVDKGNFFSMRRYLTPLHLYSKSIITEQTNNSSGSNTVDALSYDDLQERIASVNAALSALHQDLKQWLQSGDAMDKVTIPPHVLIPNITQYLLNRETSNYALQTLASLLALESLSTKNTYAKAVYLQQQQQDGDSSSEQKDAIDTLASSKEVMDAILTVLERSGTDRKTLYVQEQAARVLFYLSERPVLVAVGNSGGSGSSGDNENKKSLLDSLDSSRALRNLLDHTSTTQNPNLQRWSAAGVQHFICEDQRRSTEAVNQAAAELASGYDVASDSLAYKSNLDECLVQTGGVMILCSLVGADDADTRTHAVSALSSLLDATRSINQALQTLSEMSGGVFSGGNNDGGSSTIRAMIAGGACAGPLAQLLLSADTTVASMGANFVASLVTPLLADPLASASMSYQYNCRNDQSVLGAYREAALDVAQGPCLPALLSLLRDNRPVSLRQVGLETLAAVVLAVSVMAQAWISGSHTYEQALQKAPAPLRDSLIAINDEDVQNIALQVLQQSGSSLGVNNKKETPHSRMREAAGMILGSLTSVSAEAIMNLTVAHANSNVLAQLLQASNDNTMTVASTLLGDGSPRCLGALETVANILMFAWQHPSGAASELLDRMIEVMDAGAIPYASKILNSKIDWDSRDKSVGAMKGRTAACKLLACLFGIPLTDETGIGMRRLMDAVDSDARSYRGGDRAPSNIVEAVLSCLQTASNKAKSAMLGTLDQGPHYQAALMDLVGASLLATGSMCGSSVAPGGSEGTMIQAESFLTQRHDMYVSRRKEICSVACEVVVRGGRNSPSLLPTMLVGGFGEESVLASLRLALAIAQNGTVDQHAKLALSGILVPISDSLRSALTKGDLYKFSASLALVRFCGPHVAAGQGGGIESVRDAIRVATNVLTLPINPDASLEQLETQEALKSECIAALESLSLNASLWSSISSDALPSIVRYLQNPNLAFTTTQGVDSRVAALRAVLQIVQVPSHAIAAAENGIVEALGELLTSGDPSVAMPALQVLHVVASNDQARRKARFLETGLIQSVCTSLGKTTAQSSSAEATTLGLEIIANIAKDLEKEGSLQQILVSPKTSAFLDSCCGNVQFIKALCASFLHETRMKLRRHDDDCEGEEYYDIPDMYGPPLNLLQGLCNNYTDTHIAASALLFQLALYACAIDSRRSDTFWSTFFLQNEPESTDSEDCSRLAATMCAHFLSMLTKDYEAFVPQDSVKKREYLTIARPLVRHKLLQGLKDAMEALDGDRTYGNTGDPYITSLIVEFNIPHVCLSLWRDPALLDLAFELLKQIVDHNMDDVIHLFVQGKPAMLSLFDLLNVDQSSIETSSNVNEIRRFLATILGNLAEKGLLTKAVEQYDVRSSAIAALASACLSEEERPADDDEETTSHRLSSSLMQCLVELCSVKEATGEKKRIQLSSAEADELAKNVGQKICHMVLSRFLERAKLKEYEMDDDEDIMDAPDVAMLCAVAQHDSALKILQSIGGLHALSLVAAEGETTAMVALKNACREDAAVLLEGDTFKSIMTLISLEDASWRHNSKTKYDLESSAFELLSRLASGSSRARTSVAQAEHCEDCLLRAIDILTSLTKQEDPASDTDDESTDQEPVDDEKEEKKKPAQDWMKPPPTTPSKEEEMLGKGACLFLSALISTDVGRRCFGDNAKSLISLADIINNAADVELQHAALKLVAASSRYASADGEISVNWLSDVLTSVLLSERKVTASGNVNSHAIKSLAVSGIIGIFDLLSADKQKSVADAAKSAFVKIIKLCAVIRSSTKEGERASLAEAAHNLLTILLVARGKDGMDAVYSQELLVACIHIMQWRHDPKTSFNPSDKMYWDGSITMCLQLLYFTLAKPQVVLEEAKIDSSALAATTLMLARPGKAPRKAIDVWSMLERVIALQDSSCIFAQSVLTNLFD